MFGKSGDSKKIKELEKTVKNLEETVKKLRWDLANQKVEFNAATNEFGKYSLSLPILQKEIHELKEELKKVKTASPLNTVDVPNIPWVHEVITNPDGACFNCLPIKQKLKVWESIFNNIGFTSKYDIIERYPFHFVEEEMEEFSMTQLGHLYFSELGTGYDGYETCRWLINLRDLKMISDEYPQMINKIVEAVLPNTNIQNYKEVFNKDNWQFTLTFQIKWKDVKLEFEGTKYLDFACINQLVTHLKDNIEEPKSFYSFNNDFALNLCYIDGYQKMMIEKMLQLKKPMEPVPNQF